MIWDSFLYAGERMLLEIRLHELAPVADGFIIVESDTTHSGKPKDRDIDYLESLPYHINYLYVDLPNKGDISDALAAENEVFQRNAIASEINPSDTVILSDVDEIPRRETIDGIMKRIPLPVKIRCSTRYYYLNQEGPAPFCEYGPVVVSGADVLRVTPQMLRACIYSPDMPSIEGGYHLTFIGDIEKKMNMIAHHTDTHRERYLEALRSGVEGLKTTTDVPYLVREKPENYTTLLK